ncbi:HpcH/HpaI aldolase/citrate lyase family protein [Sphingomonas azotifigens]|uniref:HpcH/HpaI aldolase/citrate lyase family protein n=1 Tax=Sphingomonas azotifigens TaxID=330920 RepID=UPI000A04A5B9|nr:CoA ester lyase [Sphingomonas azotifigens]
MRLRSLLFVPGDRPERFDKAAQSGADALILDLEDSVVADRKPLARDAIAEWLAATPDTPSFVRVNPLETPALAEDLAALAPLRPTGLVLPKASGAATIRALVAAVAQAGAVCPPILPIATETPAALFQLGSYGEVAAHLAGLTWGAEDLPAAIGAAGARQADGDYTAPFAMVRSLALFGAHAAGVAAIETVYPDIADREGLERYVARGRRDGFTGMMAIHPAQIEAINAGFTPSDEEIAAAQAIVAAFAANPEAGALKLDGRMIDRPHLEQARRLLARAG